MSVSFYGVFVEPYQIRTHHVWIHDSALSKVLGDRTIVHLSDLHISTFGKREEKVLKMLDELKPDFVVLTGDYVTWGGDYNNALDFLSKVKANEGVWAVLGDYDFSNSRKSCLFCHEEGSGRMTSIHTIRFLRDTFERVDLPSGALWIGGVDIAERRPFISRENYLLLQKNEPLVLLCHDPLLFDVLDDRQRVIVLSGDTHGGQIPLPSWVWSAVGYKRNAVYNDGLFEVGNKKMYVSRGIGTSHFPIRFLKKPEVVVLHFC